MSRVRGLLGGLLVGVAAWVSAPAGSRALPAEVAPVALTPGLPAAASVVQFVVSPDGSRVAHVVLTAAGQYELWSGPTNGSAAPVRLHGDPPAGADGLWVGRSPRFSADGSRLVFGGDFDTADAVELWSAPVDGSAAPSRLSHASLPVFGEIADFAVAPVGDRVVFTANSGVGSSQLRLFTVGVDGVATPSALMPVPPAGGDVRAGLEFTVDGSTVVFRGDIETDEVFELWSVPADGSAAPARLSHDSLAEAFGDVVDFGLSPTGDRVAFRAYAGVGGPEVRLFTVDVDGAAEPAASTPVPPAGGNVRFGYEFTADGSWVVFRGDIETAGAIELWSMPADGSAAPARLSHDSLAGFGDVHAFAVSPAGDRVVFRAPTALGVPQLRLFTVDVGGVADPSPLIPAPPAGSNVDAFELSPDGSQVTYAIVGSSREGFVMSLDGGPSTPLPIPPGDAMGHASFGGDGAEVIYVTFDVAGSALWAVPAAGGSALRLDAGPGFAPVHSIGEFKSVQTAAGLTVVFRADPDNSGSARLFSVLFPTATPPPGGGGGGGAEFVGVVPARLWDTRQADATVDGVSSGGGRLPAGSVSEVLVAGRGGVTSDATSATVVVTMVGPDDAGYATVFPCGTEPPTASTSNYQPGADTAATVDVGIGIDGKVCVFTSAASQAIMDVTGYHPAGSQFSAITPGRVADTRQPAGTLDGIAAGGGPVAAGSVTQIPIVGRYGITTAAAVAATVTAVTPQEAGYMTAWDCAATPPVASNLNYRPLQDRANMAVINLSAGGQLCIYSSAASHLVVDITGYYPTATGFATIAPTRYLDTRHPAGSFDGIAAGGGPIPGGHTISVPIAGRGDVPADVDAVVMTLTAVGAAQPGYATIWPCNDAQPTASIINYQTGDVANTAFLEPAPDGTVCVYTDQTSDYLIDITGYYA